MVQLSNSKPQPTAKKIAHFPNQRKITASAMMKVPVVTLKEKNPMPIKLAMQQMKKSSSTIHGMIALTSLR